jgi:cytochrome c-type biogenesis protein CcmF
MQFGIAMIYLAFAATLVSALFYYLNEQSERQLSKKNKKEPDTSKLRFARLTYNLMVLSLTAASIYLLYLLITHQFQVKYVFQYSSRDLSLGLLISTFWAGQQGSFLLWALLTALMGLMLKKTSREFENQSMLFLNIIMAFFLGILIKASPFELSPQTPPDGSGLNPLLQNFWMVIHPPILFVGYAAITFPLVLSLTALIKRRYDAWIPQAFPWTIFSSLTLGAGIIIGAFWAYETLGWGGYWGWDPVENSSLIPWLTILALLHGLIVQKRKGGFAKTNFIFAILAFNLVLYATFLTRSGVLADFSVHSFQELGINSLLILFMGVTLIFSLTVFFKRSKEIKKQPVDWSKINRENALTASLWVFAASAFLIFIGTSSPIITGLLGKPSQVDISFYDKVNLPVGILMALLLGITPFLYWVDKDNKTLLKRLVVPLILAVIPTIIIILAGLSGPLLLIFIFCAFFAVCSNIITLVRQWRVNWHNIAAPLAHFGVGIIFIGIIVSGNFSVSERILLEKDTSISALGYQLIYREYEMKSDGKHIAHIYVSDGVKEFIATPRLYATAYNNEVMREPYIAAGFISDLYISPLERRNVVPHDHGSTLSMVKGEQKAYAGFDITFTGFEMANHQSGDHFRVGAVLEFVKEGQKFVITPALLMGAKGRQMEPALLPSKHSDAGQAHPSVVLAGLNADQKRIDLVFRGLNNPAEKNEAQREQLIIEISEKPFMGILWVGSVLLLVGTAIAFKKRLRFK